MKALNQSSIDVLAQFASQQAQWHRDVRSETAKLITVQAVTQPNSRSTAELHRFALAETARAQAWAKVAQ